MNATSKVSFVWNISVHFEFFQVDVLFIICVLFRKTQVPHAVQGKRYFSNGGSLGYNLRPYAWHRPGYNAWYYYRPSHERHIFVCVVYVLLERSGPRGKLKDSPPSLPPTHHIYYLPLGLLFIQEATQKNQVSTRK